MLSGQVSGPDFHLMAVRHRLAAGHDLNHRAQLLVRGHRREHRAGDGRAAIRADRARSVIVIWPSAAAGGTSWSGSPRQG